MTAGIKTVIYPVKDLAQATALYRTLLGMEPYAASPYYVGFRVGEQEIGLDPNGLRRGTGPLAYHHVDDIKASLQQLLDAGAAPLQDVTDVGGGRLIAIVKDADTNMIGLLQNA
jgi:predicted enzyme related to lactoylglutathione lyase